MKGAVRQAIKDALIFASRLVDGKGLPVDVERVAKDAGVTTIEPREMKVDGYLGRRADGGLVIRYKCDAPPARRRFTIAHEIGHILLAKARGISIERESFQRGVVNIDEELAANRVAASLLMPEIPLRQYLASKSDRWRIVEQCCFRFRVSASAMVNRILEADGLPAVFFRVPTQSNAGRSFRVRVSVNQRLMFPLPPRTIADEIVRTYPETHFCHIPVCIDTRNVLLSGAIRTHQFADLHEWWIVGW